MIYNCIHFFKFYFREIRHHRPTGVILVLGERQDSDPLCQSIKELKIFPDQPPTSTVWSFISGFQNNPVEKTYETFAKISDVLCKYSLNKIFEQFCLVK